MIDVPAVVRNKARAVGAEDWLERLPTLVSSLEADWSIAVGHPYEGGTEAFVADATRADGTPAVLKVLVPGTANNPSDEAAVLRLVGGDGCPVLYRYDPDEGALLMERLGRPVYELGLPLARRLEILCATAERIWRPAPDCGLPAGADKARWLADFIVTSWEELDRPCSEKAVDRTALYPHPPTAPRPRHAGGGRGRRRPPARHGDPLRIPLRRRGLQGGAEAAPAICLARPDGFFIMASRITAHAAWGACLVSRRRLCERPSVSRLSGRSA